MSLERRITELEARLGKRGSQAHFVITSDSYALGDEQARAEINRQALAENPAPADCEQIFFINFVKPKETME